MAKEKSSVLLDLINFISNSDILLLKYKIESKEFSYNENFSDFFCKNISDLFKIKIFSDIISLLGLKVIIDEEKLIKKNCQKFKKKYGNFNLEWLVFLDELDNKIIFFCGRFIGLTPEIKSTKDFYENMISEMPGHIYWKDKNSIFMGCNDAQAKKAGLKSRHEIIGKTAFDLPWKKNAKRLYEIDRQIIKTGLPYSSEEPAIRNDGTEGTFLSEKVPLKNSNGEIIGILGISFDITERKKMENKIKKLNISKNKFIENISRIIRTPISSIIGIVELLKYEKLNAQQNHKLNLIKQSADKIIPLFDRINYYASLEVEEILSSYTPFELKSFFEKKIKLYQDISRLKQIEFTTKISKKIPEWLLGNTHYLSQIIDIILDNAIKFTLEGKISVHVDFKDMNQSNILLYIFIEDTGIGIPDENLKIIFGLFDDDTNQENEFSSPSVNVSIMKRLVNLMKGDVKVNSKVNEGTKIFISLPFQVTEKPALNIYPAYNKDNFEIEVKRDSIDLYRELKILILEDDTIQQYVFKELLNKEFNCAIDKAFSLSEAKKYNPKDYDLIFLDMNLPDGKGIDFLRELSDDVKNKVPIIAVTGCTAEEEKDAMAEAGVTDIIIKPVNLEILKFVVNEYVK